MTARWRPSVPLHQVHAQAVQQRSRRTGQHRGADTQAGNLGGGQHHYASEANQQGTGAAHADLLAEEQEGDQRGEQHGHRIADRADRRRRLFRCIGEQHERQRRVDQADRRQPQPAPRRELRAGAPQERQQHQRTQHQPHFDQRERAERRHRHPHEQERAAPDGAQQGQFQRRAPIALGRLWDRIHALPPYIVNSSPRRIGSGADARRTSA
ncbi:hypothetical protein FLFIOBJN_01435 [Stenotrophomonas maltophilia]|nr:hypothetical protein FLFIOBJN_01435 [Stenotrophomonas maltophilia]